MATLTKRAASLVLANEIRSTRAQLKRRIASERRPGAATAARVLLRNPEFIRAMDVGEFLLWVWWFDKPTVRKMLERRRVSPWCPIDELPDRKRRELVDDLIAYANAGRA